MIPLSESERVERIVGPMIEGIQSGRDEVLESAVEYLQREIDAVQ